MFISFQGRFRILQPGWRWMTPEHLIKNLIKIIAEEIKRSSIIFQWNNWGHKQILCNLLRQQSAPVEYHYLTSSFKEAVECKIDDPHGRLVCLLEFTDGEAKETIQHCIQQSPEVGYRLAKTLLEEHYRNPHRILVAYGKEIQSWASLKQGDSSHIGNFTTPS